MKGEIVSTQTSDKVRLHGLYCQSDLMELKPKSVFDAVVLTHGLASNFYSSRFLNYLAHSFLEQGLAVVVGNTRGHDQVNRVVRMGRTVSLGAAFEQVSDCQFDLSGWCDFLVSRGHKRIVLAGHSLGAIKSLYSSAYQPHANVKAIVCLSATRLNYEHLMESSGREAFIEMMAQSNTMIEQGRGDELMQVTFPFPTMMSASAYRNKYGNKNEYDWVQFFHRVNVPTFLVFGGIELDENAAFEGLREELPGLCEREHADYCIIERADHFYSACYPDAAKAVKQWLNSQTT